MPRILIAGLCCLPGPDRPGVQLRHVIKALARRYQVDVLVARRGDQAYVERFETARVLRVPISGREFGDQVEAFRRALRRQLEGADYDVVHFRDGWSGLPALELQGRLGYATVFDVARSPMSEPVLTDLTTASELERVEEACVRRADLVLAPSEASRPYLAGLATPGTIHVVPPGVDVDAFDWEAPPTVGPPRILYLGSLAPGRGVRVLLRAMFDVARSSDARLVLAGYASPPFRDSLARAISDLDLGDRVELLGELRYEQAPQEIARATVCVAPGAVELSSRGTALYPTKLLEYMACQRAVVAPRRGTVSMLLRDGQHGLLFEPGHPHELAQAILRLLADRGLRERLGRAGYDSVRRVHTASGTRRQLARAYAWLAERDEWRERLAHRPEEPSAEGVAPMPTGDFAREMEVGDAAAMRSGRSPSEFGGDSGLLPADDTDERQLAAADVTQVQPNPLVGDGDEPEEGSVDGGLSTDEWDALPVPAREPGAAAESRIAQGPPIDDHFVAGELEVPAARPELAHPLASMTAEMAPVGSIEIDGGASGGAFDDVMAARGAAADDEEAAADDDRVSTLRIAMEPRAGSGTVSPAAQTAVSRRSGRGGRKQPVATAAVPTSEHPSTASEGGDRPVTGETTREAPTSDSRQREK